MSPYPSETLFLDGADAIRLGRRIAAWRALHGVSSPQLAAALGTNRWELSRIEHAARPITLELALRVCEVTGLAINGNGVSFRDVGTLPVSPI